MIDDDVLANPMPVNNEFKVAALTEPRLSEESKSDSCVIHKRMCKIL